MTKTVRDVLPEVNRDLLKVTAIAHLATMRPDDVREKVSEKSDPDP